MLDEKEGLPEVATTIMAAVAACATVGFIFLSAFGITALQANKRSADASFQKSLVDLQCVHVGYRGRSETKVYSCGGRLMERGRDGLQYSS